MSRTAPGTLFVASRYPSTPDEAVRSGSGSTEDSRSEPGAFAKWRGRVRPRRRVLVLVLAFAVVALAWFRAPELVFALLSGLGVPLESGTSTDGGLGGEQVASVLRMWLPVFSIYWFIRRDIGQMEDRLNRRFADADKRAADTKADLIQRIAEVKADLIQRNEDTKADLIQRIADTKADLVKQIEDTKADLGRQIAEMGKRIDRLAERMGRVEGALMKLARGSDSR